MLQAELRSSVVEVNLHQEKKPATSAITKKWIDIHPEMTVRVVLYHFDQTFRWRVTGGHELNKFDLGDGDIAILGVRMSKKCKDFESSKCQ
jgi:hypothetical protein